MKLHNTKLPLVVAIAAILGACSSIYEPKPEVTPLGQDTVVSNTASLSHVIIYNKKSNNYTCTQPPPDATFSQSEQGDVSVSLVSVGSGSDAGGESEGSQETELAGRTPTVLITRELLYRLCEFSKNHDLDKKDATALYTKTLEIVKSVWSIEAGETTVSIGDKVSVSATESVSGAGKVTLPVTSSTASASSYTSQSTCEAAGFTWSSDSSSCS